MSTRVLSSLIGVDDLRLAIASDGFTQQGGLIFFLQTIGKLPADDKSPVKISSYGSKHESVLHWDVGHTDCPDLLWPGNTRPTDALRQNLVQLPAPGNILLR